MFPTINSYSEDEPINTQYGKNNKGNQNKINRLKAIYDVIMDDSINNVKVNNQIYSKIEFIKKYFFNYSNINSFLNNNGSAFLLGEVINNNIIERTITFHVSKKFDTPRIIIKNIANVNMYDIILVYMNKENINVDVEIINHRKNYILTEEKSNVLKIDSKCKDKIINILEFKGENEE